MVDGRTPSSTVNAIVLSYGTQREAAALIDELCADGEFPAEAVLEVHNPATPGEAVLADRGQQVVNLPVNVGYAGAMNVGIRQLMSRAEYLMLLTQDVRIAGAAVQELVEAVDADSELAVVGPLLVEDGTIWSAGKERGFSWQYRHIADAPRSRVSRVDSLDGSALLVRVKDLPPDLLDEGFFMYFEETELIERIIRSTGHGVAVVASAAAESAPGWTSRPKSHAYLMARNGMFVARQHGGVRACCVYAVGWGCRTALDIARAPNGIGKPPAGRMGAVRSAFAGCIGIVHSLLQKTGPPPWWLQDGDLRV